MAKDHILSPDLMEALIAERDALTQQRNAVAVKQQLTMGRYEKAVQNGFKTPEAGFRIIENYANTWGSEKTAQDIEADLKGGFPRLFFTGATVMDWKSVGEIPDLLREWRDNVTNLDRLSADLRSVNIGIETERAYQRAEHMDRSKLKTIVEGRVDFPNAMAAREAVTRYNIECDNPESNQNIIDLLKDKNDALDRAPMAEIEAAHDRLKLPELAEVKAEKEQREADRNRAKERGGMDR